MRQRRTAGVERYFSAFALLLFCHVLEPSLFADTGYDISVILDLNSSRLEGAARIIISGKDIPRDDLILLNRAFGWGRKLELSGVEVNGRAVEVGGAGDEAGILLPDGARNGSEISIDVLFRLAALPESEGIILLDDNRRGRGWETWYPRLVEPQSVAASYKVRVSLLGGGALAHSAPSQARQETGTGAEFTLEDPSATGIVLAASRIFIQERIAVSGCDLGLFYREGSDAWARLLEAAASEVYGYYAEQIPGFQRARLDIVFAAEDYAFSDFRPQIVIIKDESAEMAERFGAVFAANYLRWKAAVEMAAAFWQGRLGRGADGIPWLREGLALQSAEDYSSHALLGGPAFDNIRQYYLNAAAANMNTSLARSWSEAESDGINPLDVLARSKGLWVVGMLRESMGRAGWLEFQRELALLPPGSAPSTEDIKALAERASKKPLDRFFQTWVESDDRVDYALGSVRSEDGGVRVQIKSAGQARPPVMVRAVFGEGSETLVSIEGSGGLRRVEIDPDGELPDIKRSDNFRSFGGSERIEQLYAIDGYFDIGEIIITRRPAKEDDTRVGEFELTITNRLDRQTALGLRITTRFPGGRNRKLIQIFLEFAPNEAQTIRERLPFPPDGTGQAEVRVDYYRIADRAAFERLGKSDNPSLTNFYVVETADE
jgi:hypothetical protein